MSAHEDAKEKFLLGLVNWLAEQLSSTDMDPDRPRRRPGRPTPGKFREALLRAAMELVAAQGVHHTGIKQIAEVANTTAQTLYGNFDNKADLVAAAVEAWGANWRAWLDTELAAVRPGRERLLAVFDVLERWLIEQRFRGSMVINVGLELTDRSDPSVQQVRTHQVALLAMLASYAGEAGLQNPVELAQTWLVLIDGAICAAVLDGNADAVRVARAAAVRLLDTAD